MASIEDIHFIVNQAIDYAFTEQKYNLNFYEYLKQENYSKEDTLSFLNSSTGIAIVDQVSEIQLYLDGGDAANVVRESYGWMGKPRARKIKEYLEDIVDGAKEYAKTKRRGRKKKSETSTK